MSAQELDRELADGVAFWGYEDEGRLLAVMGLQPVRDVTLIRHAYVAPSSQRGGIGGALLRRLVPAARGRLLVGTWDAATWAIDFYRRHGFDLVDREQTA